MREISKKNKIEEQLKELMNFFKITMKESKLEDGKKRNTKDKENTKQKNKKYCDNMNGNIKRKKAN